VLKQGSNDVEDLAHALSLYSNSYKCTHDAYDVLTNGLTLLIRPLVELIERFYDFVERKGE